MPAATGDTDDPESLVAELLVCDTDRHAEALGVSRRPERDLLLVLGYDESCSASFVAVVFCISEVPLLIEGMCVFR